MSSFTASTSQRIQGNLLVLLQFGLILLLVLISGPIDALRAGRWEVGLAFAASAVMGLLALLANPPGNFNIRPNPKSGGRLVEHGIYRRVRHPMYTAVIVFGLGCALAAPSITTWLAAALLFGVLLLKAIVEERLLSGVYEGYADYMRRTQRFIPGLF